MSARVDDGRSDPRWLTGWFVLCCLGGIALCVVLDWAAHERMVAPSVTLAAVPVPVLPPVVRASVEDVGPVCIYHAASGSTAAVTKRDLGVESYGSCPAVTR